MARFVLTWVDIAPDDLRAQLPVTATVVGRMAGPDRDDYWCARLDSPLKYHLPHTFDHRRAPMDLVTTDEDGPFLVVDLIVVCPRWVGTQLHHGMRYLTVNIGYVIDPDAASSEVLDPSGVDFVGVGTIDDVASAVSEAPAVTVAPEPTVGEQQFKDLLERWLDRLSAAAGEPPGYIPEPAGGKEDGVYYRIEPNNYSYLLQCNGDVKWVRNTTDPDELVYWIVSDVADSLARRAADRDPAAESPGDRRRLWLPRWHHIMDQLSPEWGSRTARRIDALLASDR